MRIVLHPEKAGHFDVKIRIPGWAAGKENPFGLYTSIVNGKPEIEVCGEKVPMEIEDGYAVISRKWHDGDEILLNIPMEPRFVRAHEDVKQLVGKTAIACGPIVYCIESVDNEGFDGSISQGVTLESCWREDLLGGINTVVGVKDGKDVFTAIPYYAVGNRIPGAGYTTWAMVGK